MIEDNIGSALREIVMTRAALDSLEARLVARARSSGATWSEVGTVLGLSKQGARMRHLATDPIFGRRSQKPPTIEDFHAEFVAAMRVQGVSLE